MSFLYLLSILLFFSVAHQGAATCRPVRRCLSALQKGKECPTIPVPKDSLGPPPGPEGYLLQELRNGVYSWYDGTYFSLILFKANHLTLIDFPNGNRSFRNGTYLLNEAVKKVLGGSRPTRVDMIYGHRHLDHVGGAGPFYSFIHKLYPGVKTYVWGTEETRTFFNRNDISSPPKINIIVGEKGKTMYVSPTLKVKLTIIGGHTQSDIAMLIEESSDGPGILHFVDVVNPGSVPFFNFGLTVDLSRYLSAQKELLKLPFTIFSAGHGRLGNKDDIRLNIEYTQDSLTFMEEAATEVTQEELDKAGLPGVNDPNAPQYRHGGFSFMVPFGLQSAVCSKKLIEKYGCRLGSVEYYSVSHCQMAFLFNNIQTP